MSLADTHDLDRLAIGSNHPPEPLDPIPALQLDIDQLVDEIADELKG